MVAGNNPMTARNDLMATGNDPAIASARVIEVRNDHSCYNTGSQRLEINAFKTFSTVPLKIKQKGRLSF
jgi:hypothetical protein